MCRYYTELFVIVMEYFLTINYLARNVASLIIKLNN
jgi:hypothetical protein